ncbi:hypothetical protein L6R50_15855 [Myxococcota bacterium]|nr:hypothetical protein [Myxococcota bacterium]
MLADVWAAPDALLPETMFTDGNLFAAVLGGDGVTNGDLWRLWTFRTGGAPGAMFRPLFWPTLLLAAAVGPVLALNLTWALVPALNAAGGYLLGRSLGASSTGGALAGALLAWCPWVRTTLANGQIEQAALGLVAATWAAAAWGARGRWARVPVVAAVALAVALAAPNLALAAMVGLGPLAAGALARERGPWRRWLALLAAVGAAGLVASAYHGPNFEEGVPNVFWPRQGEGDALNHARVRDFFAWPYAHRGLVGGTQHSVYLGWAVLLAGGAGLAAGWRRAWPLAAGAVTLWLLALGPHLSVSGIVVPMPLRLLEILAPPVAASATAYRFAAGVVVALAGTAAVGLDPGDRPAPPLPRLRSPVLALALAASAWAETTLMPGAPLPLETRPAWHHPELAALRWGTGTVLDLPLPDDAARACGLPRPPENHYLNALGLHDRPLPYSHMRRLRSVVHFGRDFQRFDVVRQVLGGPDCAGLMRAALQQAGVNGVVLHGEPECAWRDEERACLWEALGPPAVVGTTAIWVDLGGGPGS